MKLFAMPLIFLGLIVQSSPAFAANWGDMWFSCSFQPDAKNPDQLMVFDISNPASDEKRDHGTIQVFQVNDSYKKRAVVEMNSLSVSSVGTDKIDPNYIEFGLKAGKISVDVANPKDAMIQYSTGQKVALSCRTDVSHASREAALERLISRTDKKIAALKATIEAGNKKIKETNEYIDVLDKLEKEYAVHEKLLKEYVKLAEKYGATLEQFSEFSELMKKHFETHHPVSEPAVVSDSADLKINTASTAPEAPTAAPASDAKVVVQ